MLIYFLISFQLPTVDDSVFKTIDKNLKSFLNKHLAHDMKEDKDICDKIMQTKKCSILDNKFTTLLKMPKKYRYKVKDIESVFDSVLTYNKLLSPINKEGSILYVDENKITTLTYTVVLIPVEDHDDQKVSEPITPGSVPFSE